MEDSITVNGVEYVRKSSNEKPYVIIRSDRAGVFAGNLISRIGNEVILDNSRRIFFWAGAASLSQLAVDGTSKPKECKFPAPLDGHTILGVIEVIPCSEKAKKSISEVKVWQE